jgi:hypothetical protein
VNLRVRIDAILPIIRLTFGMCDRDDIDFVPPIEEDKQIGKALEQNAPRSVQIGGITKRMEAAEVKAARTSSQNRWPTMRLDSAYQAVASLISCRAAL